MEFSKHIGIAGVLCAVLVGVTLFVKVSEFLAPTFHTASVTDSVSADRVDESTIGEGNTLIEILRGTQYTSRQ